MAGAGGEKRESYPLRMEYADNLSGLPRRAVLARIAPGTSLELIPYARGIDI